jgi:hypothetical protein
MNREVDWDRVRRFKWSDAAPPPEWDPSIRPISQKGLSLFAMDDQGGLYWDGRLIETRGKVRLTWPQTIGALIVGIFTVAGGLGGALQGWVAYTDWSCRIEWQQGCPPRSP